MNSKKSFTSGPASASSKGNNVVEVSNATVEQLNRGVADVKLDSAPDGDWEVYKKKPKGKAVGNTPNNWGPQKQPMPGIGWWRNPNQNARGSVPADSRRPSGRGNGRPQPQNLVPLNNYRAPAAVQAPFTNGRNWASVAGSGSLKESASSGTNGSGPPADMAGFENDEDDEDDEDDFDDDDLASDEFDSDVSQKSHDTRKKNRWFEKFFESLDAVTPEEINEPGRQWHCPACHGGPGAINWFKGLQPLIVHAKTKGSKRVKLHREFADLLDEELIRRGTSAYPSGEAFGKWKGLTKNTKDHEIVWPPMLIIRNTQLEKDENEKWLGMGNQELIEYFQDYNPVKARHSYGPQGHRGLSVLIFEGSAVGYSHAERLHKHLELDGIDREAWDQRPVLLCPGGKRQLYGFLATREDMDDFNRHYQGKSKLKYDLRSHHEMVVIPLQKMSEDNQQLNWLKNKVAKEQRHSKALEESFGIVSEKLRQTMEENRIVRQRTKWQHEEYREEMDSQESFYKEQMKVIHEARDAKDDEFEMEQQEKREKVKQLNAFPSIDEDSKARERMIKDFIKSQDTEMQAFVEERDRLGKLFEDKKVEMKRRHWEEAMQLEKNYDAELAALMDKYASKVANSA